MPKIIDHLPRLKSPRVYDEFELARLQLVYDRARQVLAIDTIDPRRERLAMVIFQLADLTEDPDELLSRAVTLFKRPS